MSDLTVATSQKQVDTKKNPTVRDLLGAQRPAIEMQLAGAMNTDAFVRAVLSSVNKSPDLQLAEPSTLLGSVMLAAQLRLEIGPALGHFYLTPRKEKGVQICLPIIGYKGYIELAYRSNRIAKIETFLVREGDQFSHGANSERGRFFDWTPEDYDENRAWTGVVGVAQIKGGGTVWAYLPKVKVLARRPGHWKYTPWATNEEEMARKTIIRAMAPYLPMSVDLGRAIEADEAKVQHIAGAPELQVTPSTGEPEIVVADERDLDEAHPDYVAPDAA